MVNIRIVNGLFDISDMIEIMLRRDVPFTNGGYIRLLVLINIAVNEIDNSGITRGVLTIKMDRKCTHHRKKINKDL